MIDIHSSITPLAGVALDALSLNQKLLATNIAQANTQGYNASRIDFQDYMNVVLNRSESVLSPAPDITGYIQTSSEPVSQDMELAAMQENLQRFKAIVDVLNRQSGIMQLAMKGRID